MPRNDCPLTPALLSLLDACAEHETLSTEPLAEKLCRSPNTIRTEFNRILQVLGVHTRYEALVMAARSGWIGSRRGDPATRQSGTTDDPGPPEGEK